MSDEIAADLDPFLTVPEIVELVRLTRPTVVSWIDSGVLPHYRLGPKSIRVAREDLDQFLAARRFEGPPVAPVPSPTEAPPAAPARVRRPGNEKYMPLPPEGGDMDAGNAGEANGDEAAA